MLSTIPAQPRAIAQLTSALSRGRVHHAWLFAGPRGAGKEATARAFAASLLCQSAGGAPVVDACGVCPACAKLARNVHPDLLVLMPEAEAVARKVLTREDLGRTPSRELKIDQIREVEGQLVRAPLEGDRRVVLILGADTLNVPAQNAFLKTLEEPPEGTHIVLVADAGDSLLPTIRSRCVRVPFAPPPLAVPPDSRDQRAELVAAVEALTPGDLRPALALAERIGKESDVQLELLAIFYRDVAVAAEGLGDEALANGDIADTVRKAAARGAEEALRRYRLVLRTKDAIRRHAAARLAVEKMLLSFVMPEVA